MPFQKRLNCIRDCKDFLLSLLSQFGKIGEIFHLQTSTKFLALSDVLNILFSLYYLTIALDTIWPDK